MRKRNCPECHWVTVDDGSGRRRVEMRWLRAAPVGTTAVPEARQAA
jgi:hypothetical protein